MTASTKEILAASARAFWRELPVGVRLSGKAIVYAPVFAKSVAAGLSFPDLDIVIPGVGIGGHRWVATHSAAAAWLTKCGLATINDFVENPTARQAMKELTTTAGAGFAIGMSVHLLKDAFIDGNQTVRFKIPFIGGPGTILTGTYVDDDLWFAGNGLYALKLAGDMLLMGFGEDAMMARKAFQEWRDQKTTIREINQSRMAALRESRQLSENLRQRIPVDTDEAPFPKWLRR